jgi:hypothetical protein
MLLLIRIIGIFISVKVTLIKIYAVIGRQSHQICRSPRIGREVRYPYVSHVPFKSRGREQGIVYCRIVVELVRFGGDEWREFEGAVVGGFLRALGTSGALYILVSLGDLLAAVYRDGS